MSTPAFHMWEIDPNDAGMILDNMLFWWSMFNGIKNIPGDDNKFTVVALSVAIPKEFEGGAVRFDWVAQQVCKYLQQLESKWNKGNNLSFKEEPHVAVSSAGSGLRVLNFYGELYD